jgi:hypothetical protein
VSIERKRSLLRISKEKTRDLNIQSTNNFNDSNVRSLTMEAVINQDSSKLIKSERIKTTVKSRNLGKKLSPNYIGQYKGESFIVAGCGGSLNLHSDLSGHFVIGVNDIERILTPDFLIVVNEIRTFMRGRWDYVRDSLSPVIFSHLDNPGPITRSENLVKVELGSRSAPNLDQFNTVDFTMNSPYMGVIIAYQLGARKIGLTGVDFTQDHFFSKTGTHTLSRHVKSIDNEYALLRTALEKKGVKVANLSPISLLTSWPKMTQEQFEAL